MSPATAFLWFHQQPFVPSSNPDRAGWFGAIWKAVVITDRPKTQGRVWQLYKAPSELQSPQKGTSPSNQHDQPVSGNPAASAGRKTCQGQAGGSQKK